MAIAPSGVSRVTVLCSHLDTNVFHLDFKGLLEP